MKKCQKGVIEKHQKSIKNIQNLQNLIKNVGNFMFCTGPDLYLQGNSGIQAPRGKSQASKKRRSQILQETGTLPEPSLSPCGRPLDACGCPCVHHVGMWVCECVCVCALNHHLIEIAPIECS